MGRSLGVASIVLLTSCSSLEGLSVPADAGGGDGAAEAIDSGSDAGIDATTACSPDVLSDAKNCGRCGHDCLGGGCVGGDCQPRTLATLGDSPYGMTSDETTIYWASPLSSTIWACEKTGCDAGPRKVTTATGATFFVSSDATNVYFNSNTGDAMYRCPKTGCATPTLVTSTDTPTLNVVDGGYLWWSDNAGAVRKIGIDASGGTSASIASGLTDPVGIALDALYVYVALRGSGQLVRISRDGGASPAQLGSGMPFPRAVAVDTSGAYVGADDGQIRRWANSDFTTFSTGSGPVGYAIVLTKDDVFWTVQSMAGAIMTAPKATGLARVLAANQAEPASLVVDDRAIYWTSSKDGTVKMLAR